jgi:hypothetical protein
MGARVFITKILIFFLPVVVIICIYVVKDPFKVLYNYSRYYEPRGLMHVYLNRDHVSTATLLNHYQENKYDSYIFGSSRSENFHADKWGRYIHSDKIFHFSASGEGLYGVERKVRLIAEKNMEMKNALFAIDYSLLEQTENLKGRLFMKHRALSGQNAAAYQMEYFKTYFSREFITAYMQYLFTGKVTEEMVKKEVLLNLDVKYDLYHNEISYPGLDSMKVVATDAYYRIRMPEFMMARQGNLRYSPPIIGEKQLQQLRSIKEVLVKKNTNYVFVINPLYDQKKLARSDMQKLYELFGEDHVHDFSGINEITSDYHNYYDYAHFTITKASQVLDSIYAPDGQNTQRKLTLSR